MEPTNSPDTSPSPSPSQGEGEQPNGGETAPANPSDTSPPPPPIGGTKGGADPTSSSQGEGEPQQGEETRKGEAATALPNQPTPTPEPVLTPPPMPSSDSSASSAGQKVSPIKNLLLKAKEKIQFRKKVKLEKIVKFVQEQGNITNDQTQKLLRCGDATATRYLSELVKQGRLKRINSGHYSQYAPF